jgi:hypothetical protein
MIYLSLAISFINFLTIQYNFLGLQSVFGNMFSFGVVFVVIIIGCAAAIGWFDMKRGAMATEQSVNPYIIDTVKYNSLIVDALFLMSEGRRFEAQDKLSEARRVMERWGASTTSS